MCVCVQGLSAGLEMSLTPAACLVYSDTLLLVVLKVNMPDCLQSNKSDECVES